ncbi:MAG TPA: YerC/YecD family TrpR-related protein [Xanthomonadales bacterium]|nr:YerC/YecD family TrpR-related protein [Xanthomonadales bacterium]
MKRRHVRSSDENEPEASLYRAMLSLETVDELRAFLRDLCTPAEIEALSDRWRVIPWLRRGMAYREIHDRTGVSVTTIGRVARFLAQGNGGYRIAAERTLTETEEMP